MRSSKHLDSLATQLSAPCEQSIALMRAIEQSTSQCLSDPELVDLARKALDR